MSRTLSIGKTGPGPGFLGQALPLSQPSCGDLGVSLRRSSLQFNIRPWRISALGNPLLRLGLPRSIRQSRVAGGALGARRKRAWGSPQRPRIRPQDGMDRAMPARPSRRLAVLDHAAYRPAPARELAGGGDVGLVLVDAAPQHLLAPLHEPSDALGCVPSRRGVGCLALGQVLRMRAGAYVVPRGLDENPSQVLFSSIAL